MGLAIFLRFPMMFPDFLSTSSHTFACTRLVWACMSCMMSCMVAALRATASPPTRPVQFLLVGRRWGGQSAFRPALCISVSASLLAHICSHVGCSALLGITLARQPATYMPARSMSCLTCVVASLCPRSTLLPRPTPAFALAFVSHFFVPAVLHFQAIPAKKQVISRSSATEL